MKEINFPHSIGLLYSAFTYYLGFKVNSGEYKVMGLAPYGKPIYVDLIKEKLVSIAEDGSFHLNMSYFEFATGLTMTSKKFDSLFGGKARKSESKITEREMNLAASIQKVIEEIIIKLAKDIANETGEKNLCLAGGVALNCVVNGILLREKIFENIWIQPASGDAGGALGAALAVWYLFYNKKRNLPSSFDAMKGSYLGPEFSNTVIEADLKSCGATYEKLPEEKMIDAVVTALANEKAVGWMQGRMEFGPRALGGRSILADPRSPNMQKQLNLKVKYRESFRPFAPSVLREEVHEWFEYDDESPYMLIVANIRTDKRLASFENYDEPLGIDKLNVQRSHVPAITHVDYSARIQTVNREINPLYHRLISKFKEKTGCALIVNTSFNVRGEPLVCTPTDAYRCFMGTELDVLVIGNYLLFKQEQNQDLVESYKEHYDLD